MKIGIVGINGYVGKAFAEFFHKKYDITGYDPAQAVSLKKEQVNECDLGVICVPTPMDQMGRCDSSIVEETVAWLETPLIIIKSTVEPGTTERLRKKYAKRIVFSPEYAGESSYWTPYKFHTEVVETPFFIFGGDKKDCSALVDIYTPIAGPVKTYRITDSTSAEIAKYAENAFYAMKIAFCNEMYDVCERSGTTWNEVRELWLLDPRINPMHTLVFKNKRGFRGKCLPKDVSALVKYAETIGVNLGILKSVLESNNEKIKDR